MVPDRANAYTVIAGSIRQVAAALDAHDWRPEHVPSLACEGDAAAPAWMELWRPLDEYLRDSATVAHLQGTVDEVRATIATLERELAQAGIERCAPWTHDARCRPLPGTAAVAGEDELMAAADARRLRLLPDDDGFGPGTWRTEIPRAPLHLVRSAIDYEGAERPSRADDGLLEFAAARDELAGVASYRIEPRGDGVHVSVDARCAAVDRALELVEDYLPADEVIWVLDESAHRRPGPFACGEYHAAACA